MPYGIELNYGGNLSPVRIFDKDGNRRLASFKTIDDAEECARALGYSITASHYQGWIVVDLEIPIS